MLVLSGKLGVGLGEILERKLFAAAEGVGVARGAMDMTVDYLKQRKQFGKLIGEFQALQHRAAHLYSEVEIARAVTIKAAQLLDGGSDKADLMTHAESIELFKSLGAKFTPELKSPSVEMPHEGFSQEDYAQKLVDEYAAAGIPASDVWPQSYKLLALAPPTFGPSPTNFRP